MLITLLPLVALSSLFLSSVSGSPVVPRDTDKEITCHEILNDDQVEAIQEIPLRHIAQFKRAHNKLVTYCPDNSTLIHQTIDGDSFITESIHTTTDEEDGDVTEEVDNTAEDTTSSSGDGTSVEKRQYRWFDNSAYDCSIVCGEPNINDCQRAHRDRYYGYLWQDAPEWLEPGVEWRYTLGTCTYIIRNRDAPARNFGPDGELQVVESLYNSCLYWNHVGGVATGARAGWFVYAGHRDRLSTTNGRTQCRNSINYKKKKRAAGAAGADDGDADVNGSASEAEPVDAAAAPGKPSHAPSKTTSQTGTISPSLAKAIEAQIPNWETSPLSFSSSENNNNTSSAHASPLLSKRQYWNQANINAGTVDWRIDCGTHRTYDPSDFIDDRIMNGGNTNADIIVQPRSWHAVIHGESAFVVFNQGCCPLVVDTVHTLHNSALLAFHNILNYGTSSYGSAAAGYTAGVYFAWIKRTYVGDNNRMGRCINVY